MKKRAVIIWSAILFFILPLVVGTFVFLYALYLDFIADHYEDHQPLKSLEYLEKLNVLAPDNAYTNHRLAIYYYSQGDFRSAGNYFERELNDDQRFESNKLLCNCHFFLGLNDSFRNCSENLAKRYPEKAESHFLLGLAYFKEESIILSQNEFILSYSISNDCDALAFIVGISDEIGDINNLRKYCNEMTCINNSNIIQATIKTNEICSLMSKKAGN